MSELSIFVDESGDPGTESEYYLVTLVFHEQQHAIARYENDYLRALEYKRLQDIPMHLSPLMHGHDEYRFINVEGRKCYLAAFRTFLQYLPFRYTTFAYQKSELNSNPLAQTGAIQRIRRDLAVCLLDNLAYLQQFDKVKIYYDNGQELVTKALHDAVEFALAKDAIVYRDVRPEQYRLLQVADYACSIELAAMKFDAGCESATDARFFGTHRTFRKNFLNKLRKHRI